jgi:hypothetical protein
MEFGADGAGAHKTPGTGARYLVESYYGPPLDASSDEDFYSDTSDEDDDERKERKQKLRMQPVPFEVVVQGSLHTKSCQRSLCRKDYFDHQDALFKVIDAIVSSDHWEKVTATPYFGDRTPILIYPALVALDTGYVRRCGQNLIKMSLISFLRINMLGIRDWDDEKERTLPDLPGTDMTGTLSDFPGCRWAITVVTRPPAPPAPVDAAEAAARPRGRRRRRGRRAAAP